MKLKAFFTLLLFLATTLLVAQSSQKRISITLLDVPLSEAIAKIEKASGYTFFYDAENTDLKQKVSVSANNATIKEVIESVLKSTNLSYELANTQIVLVNKTTKNLSKQQSRTVTGIVLDPTGEPLIGASVVIKGTTNATLTDIDGKYSIKASNNDVAVFSYLGYTSKELAIGTKSNLDVTLNDDNQMLSDVVVTALGIKREKKTLTYNVQEIKASEITAVKDASFINSLAGKVAGVTINNSASGIGGSTRVVMRGTKSLIGNNNALYVIDGIPMPELKTEQPDNMYETPDGGDGDGISNINPDDIESLSVLTGAASAALYGSQGANGVVLINTKKGIKGKLSITYSNNTSFMSPFVMPKFQNRYGSEAGSFNSWGPKLETPSSYEPKDFFQTGAATTNSVSASLGTEISQLYVSASALNSRGLIPNNDYNRYNFTVRNSTTLVKDVLDMDVSFSYINQNDQNMTSAGLYYNPLVPAYLFPRGDDIRKYEVFERYDPERNFKTQFWPYGDQGFNMQNPFWIINRNMFNNEKDRFMMGASLKYKIADWINVTGRVRFDRNAVNFTRRIYASSLKLFASDYGNYLNQKSDNKYLYADGIVGLNKKLNDDILITGNVGVSLIDNKFNLTGFEGHLKAVANWFHAQNIDLTHSETNMLQYSYHDQTQSVFATAQFAYKSIYLDLTGRSDWASTFANTNTNSFFYPSVGLSSVITDMVKIAPDVLSFLKVRASYSEVGNPPQRFITIPSYTMGPQFPETSSYAAATDLEPERTKSVEIGTNLGFLGNKITLDFTYYNSNTYNQLFRLDKSPAIDGTNSEYVNGGKVNNYGFEVAIGFKQDLGPVKWTSMVTYTLNRNEIKSLLPERGITERDVLTVGTYKMILKEGGTMGDIYASTLKTDSKGNIFVDPNTGAIQADPNNFVKIGSTNPLYNLGFQNGFFYKGLELNFLIDARVGGVGVSATQALMDQFGVSEATADARDRGGVEVNGALLTPLAWYSVVAGGTTGILSHYAYSSTNVRLRELSLSYNVPSSLLGNKLQASVSLIARNLFMFYNKAPYDPELTGSTGTYFQGFDFFRQPSMRSLGFGVNVRF